MHNAARPALATAPHNHGGWFGRNARRLRGRTAIVTVASTALALLVPAAVAPVPAGAISPVGSLDSAAVVSDGGVELSGWAADSDSPTAPVRVEFRDGGTYRAAVVATRPRPDVAVAYPALGPNHGFSYELSLPDGAHQLCAWVTFTSGQQSQLGCQSVTVANNPQGTAGTATVVDNTATVTGTATDANTTNPVVVRAYVDSRYAAGAQTDAQHRYSLAIPVAEGSHNVCVYAINSGAGANSSFGCQTVVVHNNPFGRLESIAQLPLGVRVNGWAIDLNATGPVLVRAYIDGKHAADVWASLPRPDVAAAYPAAGPNHGYSFTLPVTEGTHRICTYVSNIGPGTSQQLGCGTTAVVNSPVGAVEKSVQVPGGILISGYALDLNTANPIAVHIYADGKFIAGAIASAPRPDLAAKYPTVGPNHGFSATLPLPTGSHLICAYGLNVGAGGNTKFPCVRVTMQNAPVGGIESALLSPGGIMVTGFALDPDTTNPIWVRTYVDGKFTSGMVAGAARPDLAGRFPYAGPNHGFRLFTPTTGGKHQICAYALNAGPGTVNTKFGCVTVTRAVNPYGASTAIIRAGTTNTVQVAGWALDPDSADPVQVHITVDGTDRATLTANVPYDGTLARFPLYGGSRGYSGSLNLDAAEHVVCTIAHNIGTGGDLPLGCARITTSGNAAPAVPTQLSAWPGSRQVTLSWTAPRSVNAAVTGYQITVNPGNRTAPVPGAVTSLVASGLTNGVHYTFTLRAVNSLGVGSAAGVAAVPTNIPPQTTPAPVSTSHYIRNITGNLSGDAALMRSMGAGDASRNPSGHNYLILLQIGGQDEADQGALLSATARYVTYGAVVNAMKAYLDGYVTRQRPYAPLTLAIGTNNDVDVSASAGASWARNIVNPVAAYAAGHHPGIIIAGANDMEPGFSASVGATRSWLSGYLAATSARFVFNGSADGCSTGVAGSRCNNGWSMADLQWLAGGAAPTRTISLPQIYNYSMPLQWSHISLTGTNAGRPRINFGGPLTEYTACQQAGSCGSIGNVDAWNRLWSAISSNPATRQSQMPNGTDLRIN